MTDSSESKSERCPVTARQQNRGIDDLVSSSMRERDRRVADGLNFIESLGYETSGLSKTSKLALGLGFGGSQKAHIEFVQLSLLLHEKPEKLDLKSITSPDLAALYAHVRVGLTKSELTDIYEKLDDQQSELKALSQLRSASEELTSRGVFAAEEIAKDQMPPAQSDDLFRLLMAESGAAIKALVEEMRAKHVSTKNASNAKKNYDQDLHDEIARIGRSVASTHSARDITAVVKRRLYSAGHSATEPTIRRSLRAAGIIPGKK